MWAGPHKPNHSRESRRLLRGVLRSIPWLLCITLVALGVPLFFLNTAPANQQLVLALQESSLVPPADVDRIRRALEGARLGGFIGLLISAALVGAGALAHVVRRLSGAPTGSSLRTHVAFCAAFTAVAWLLTLATAALTCVYGAWLVGAYGADALLGIASKPINGAQEAAASGVANVAQMIQDLADQAKAALEQAPPEVTSTPWHQAALQKVASIFDQVKLDGSPLTATATCPVGCISLGPTANAFNPSTSGRSSLPSCICVAATADRLRGAAQRMQGALLPAVVGCALVFVAATWMLVRGAGALALARRELKEWRIRRGMPFMGGHHGGPGLPGSPAIYNVPSAMPHTHHPDLNGEAAAAAGAPRAAALVNGSPPPPAANGEPPAAAAGAAAGAAAAAAAAAAGQRSAPFAPWLALHHAPIPAAPAVAPESAEQLLHQQDPAQQWWGPRRASGRGAIVEAAPPLPVVPHDPRPPWF